MNITESEDSHSNSQDSNGSMQLNLEETQTLLTSSSDPHSVSLLQPSNIPSPTASPQPAAKSLEKLKMMERERNSPKQNLDDSVIIEETPEKERKNESIINISDSSPMGGSRDGINLILDNSRDLNKSSGSVKEILSSSMSEILLGQNNLLYQECDNIDKVRTQLKFT